MNILLKMAVIIAIILLGIVLAVFVKKITEDDVSYAGIMIDNILEGIENKNYYQFLNDASSKMKYDSTEEKFNLMITSLKSKLGNYRGKVFNGATITHKNGNIIIVVVYKVKYSKDINDVEITITINDDNINKRIAALTFKSSYFNKITFR